MTLPPRALAGYLLLAALLGGCGGAPAEKPFPHAVLTPEPRKPVPAVRLVDGTGKPAPANLLKGQWTWLYFGFTNCPDVCPLALEYAAAEYKAMRNPKGVRVVFVSVDPKRDRTAKLEPFVDFYHKDFMGVTGDDPALGALTKAVGATYVIDPPKQPASAGASADPNYTVSHTNMVFVLDPAGRWAACYVPGAEPGAMARDFDALLARKEPT